MKKKQKMAVSARSAKVLVSRALRATEEVKFSDYNSSNGADYNASTTFYSLCDIAQGATSSTRVGDKIRIRSLHVKGMVLCADSYNHIRVIVFQWHPMSTASVPTPTDILTTLGSGYTPFSTYKDNNEGDYSILYDKTVVTVASQSNATREFDFWITGGKFFDRTVHWTAGSSSLAKNKLFLMIISDSSTNPHPTATFVTRLRYADA